MKIKVKLIRGLVGKRKEHIEALRSLGLKKIYQERVLEKNPIVCGNLEKVKHLVNVEELD